MLLASIFLCALALRIVFVREVFQQSAILLRDVGTAPTSGFMTNDSPAYIRLARDFFNSFFGTAGGYDALLRTPGYPAFLLPFYRIGWAPQGILLAQAVIGSFVPPVTAVLTRSVTGNLFLSGAAGFLSAVSPTGIGVCGLIMADLLFAALFAAALLPFHGGATQGRGNRLVLSGILFAAACLVKPILVFWPILMVPVCLLFCRAAGRPPNRVALGVAIGIQLLVLGLWCTRNLVFEGVFTPSSITVVNANGYIRPRVEEWARAGRIPSDQAVRKNQQHNSSLMAGETAGFSNKDLLQWMKDQSLRVFSAHPWITAQVLLQNMNENIHSGWDYFRRQLPLGSFQAGRAVRAAQMESIVRRLLVPAAVLFLCYSLLALFRKSSTVPRPAILNYLAFSLVFLYFASLSGTTFWTGSRITYPVECVLLVMTAMIAHGVAAPIGRFFHLPKTAFRAGPMSPLRQATRGRGVFLAALFVIGAGVYGAGKITERDADTYVKFGMALGAQARFGEALHWLEKARSLESRHPAARFHLAATYLELGRSGEAVSLLGDLEKEFPQDAGVQYLLGMALVQSGKRQDGIRHLREALRRDPGHERARQALSQVEP